MAVSYTHVAGLGPSSAGVWYVVAIDDTNPDFNKIVAETYQMTNAKLIATDLNTP